MNNNRITKIIEIQILKLYSEGFSYRAIGNILNFNFTTIGRTIKKHNVATKMGGPKKYSLNDHYFEKIDTEEKAYFLGLMYADGSVSYFNNNIRLYLSGDRDKIIIEKFKKSIEATHPLKINKMKDPNHKTSYGLSFASIKMKKDLFKLGCAPNKTFNLKFPTEEQVPKYLMRHFLRGYFDGDGSVSIMKNAANWQAYFLGNLNFLNKLSDFLKLEIGVECLIHPQRNIFQYVFTAEKCQKILKFLYEDSSIFLDRKKELYNLIKDFKKYKTYIIYDQIQNEHIYIDNYEKFYQSLHTSGSKIYKTLKSRQFYKGFRLDKVIDNAKERAEKYLIFTKNRIPNL